MSLQACFGLGVAGNFAGHLEQAGEAADFVDVDAEPQAPKGIFPFYVPGDAGFLGQFPLSSDTIELPRSNEPLNLQIEPEVGLLCEVEYTSEGVPERLHPRAIGAFNDCSIRREGARKISEKKNWGANSKGLAHDLIGLDELERDGVAGRHRIACFLRREGELLEYGIDSSVADYSYFGEPLLEWIVERLRNQQGGEDSPLEPVGEYLKACGSPAAMLVGIGATRYTAFGESNFLQPGDESIVAVYDPQHTTALDAVASGAGSVLVQTVRERVV